MVVEPVPGDEDGLFWRTRIQYVQPCRVATRACQARLPRRRTRRPVPDRPSRKRVSRTGPGRWSSRSNRRTARAAPVAGDGFWQVHPGAPRVLVETVLGMLRPQRGSGARPVRRGRAVLRLPRGGCRSDRVGDGDRERRPGRRLAKQNLAGRPRCPWSATGWTGRASTRRVRRPRAGRPRRTRPSRAGAKRQVVRAIAELAPRAVAYVACDPASLARDLAYFAEYGYRLETCAPSTCSR